MSCSVTISSLGLLLDIIGAVMLYIYGSPIRQETKEGNRILAVNYGTTEQKEERKRVFEKIQRRSRCAIGLLVIGFSLQLIGNFI